MKVSCETCKYWTRNPSGQDGSCCRFPPLVFVAGGDQFGRPQLVSAFPNVKGTLWCGEHQTRILQ